MKNLGTLTFKMVQFNQDALGEPVIKVCRVQVVGECFQRVPFEGVASLRAPSFRNSIRLDQY